MANLNLITLLQTSSSQILPKNFFTLASLSTLTGASGVVYVISSTIQRAFDFNPKWPALLIAIIVSYLAAFFTKSDGGEASKYVIALFNGCLIYLTATGSNALLGSNKDNGSNQNNNANPQDIIQQIKQPRKFSTKWW